MNNSARRSILISTTLASFLTAFMGSSVNIALPAIGKEFALDAMALGWVATAYILAAATFLVPFGRAADIHGRKRVFTYGVIAYLLTSLFAAAATSAVMLIIARVLQGVGVAMIFGTSTAILSSAYPPGERGRVLGLNVAAVYTGLSLGPFLGGLLTQNLGWHSLFLVSAAGGMISALLALRLKGEWAEARGERFDWIGAAIYGVAIVAVMYGMSRLPDWRGGALLVAGLAGVVGFVAWESRVAAPVLNLSLFKGNRVFTLSNLAALISYSATSAVTFLLSLYLQYIKGLSPQTAGLVLVAQPIMQAIFSPMAGRLSDRVESRIVASTGMTLTTLGLVMLIFLSPTTPFAYIVASLMLLGLGFALFSSPNMNAIMGAAEKRLYGVASAILATMRLTGQMLSLGIALLIFALFIGRVQITPQYYPAFLTSVQTAFAIFAGLCFVGIFASLARGNLRAQ
jgi:EmrB/QacA subfamily drug resistance transporter